MMRSRGFTLLELVIALAIMSILLGLVAPSIREWMVNTRIRTAAQAVLNGLQTAKGEALRGNHNVGLWLVTASASDHEVLDNNCALSNTSGSWVVSVSSPASHCGDAPSPSVAPMIVSKYAVGDGSDDVAIAALATDKATAANSLIFTGIGNTLSSASRIAIINFSSAQANSRPLRVEVTGGGSVRMCDPNLPAGDARACQL
jgi:type IV fimbrial biogenesis protein FimT